VTTLIITSLITCGATVFNATFDRANDAYRQGGYQTAVNLYEQLVSDGVAGADLFYNLGNAYYRLDRLGPAIANYERALHLRPGFEAAQRNLDQCLEQTRRALNAPLPPAWEQSLLFWHYRLTPATSFRLAVASWLLLWMVLGVRLWRPLPYLRRLAAVLALLALAFGASSWAKAHPALLAVASEESVPVRYGIGPEETTRFELFRGDRVRVDKRSGGWARVVTANGERGWVKESSLAFVGPPYLRPSQEPDASSGSTT